MVLPTLEETDYKSSVLARPFVEGKKEERKKKGKGENRGSPAGILPQNLANINNLLKTPFTRRLSC
jgi:hypothetical protein